MMGAMSFLLFIRWLTKTKQTSFSSIQIDSLHGYTFNFEADYGTFQEKTFDKKISLLQKIVLFVFAVLLTINPVS